MTCSREPTTSRRMGDGGVLFAVGAGLTGLTVKAAGLMVSVIVVAAMLL